MNDLLERVRAHLERCAPCLDGLECFAFALLHAESQFEARVRFRLWLDGVECLFIPTSPRCRHVRYCFPVNGGHFMTAHYTGNPAGALRSFEQTIDYARACLLSASEDLLDHLHGCRPVVAHTGPSIDGSD